MNETNVRVRINTSCEKIKIAILKVYWLAYTQADAIDTKSYWLAYTQADAIDTKSLLTCVYTSRLNWH